MELLRFLTAGSVDDGKSTLIGRLLYDSKAILTDQLESISQDDGEFNLANITDGLRAEREQGITIDVAYRYFNTAKRKFIIADTPGHVQYTRNMVTAASTANLALILIDARKGVTEQTRRHSYIVSLLGIPHVVVCVNKMDAVDYDEKVFLKIKEDFEKFAPKLSLNHLKFIPVSALKGDNIASASSNMPWLKTSPLLSYLENVHIASDRNFCLARFPVQWVARPNQDFRGFAGRISSGFFNVGDEVAVLPSGKTSKIKEIYTYDGILDFAKTPQSVILRLEDEVDISRGDLIVKSNNLPFMEKNVQAKLCWMSESSLKKGALYLLKQGNKTIRVKITDVKNKVDIENLDDIDGPELGLELNDIGTVEIKAAETICFDSYQTNRYNGGFILICPATNATLAAGMLKSPSVKLKEQIDPEYVI